MSNSNLRFGCISLTASIFGVAIPPTFAIVVAYSTLARNLPIHVPYLWLCSLFGVLELVGLACGIAARQTAPGKAGLTVSLTVVILLMAAPFLLWIVLGLIGDPYAGL
jgi:hypothetical protein